jgi:hypothetical protein
MRAASAEPNRGVGTFEEALEYKQSARERVGPSNLNLNHPSRASSLLPLRPNEPNRT